MENGNAGQQIQNILKKYPQVSYHFLPRKSRSLARNYLVQKITEDLIAFVDADVVLDKDWAVHCLNTMNSTDVAAVGCSVYRTGDSFIDEVRRKMSTLHCHNSNTLEPIKGFVVLNTAAMLIKKNCLKKMGLFDIGLQRCEDLDLTHRLLRSGFHIASAPQAKSYVTISDGVLSYLFLRPLVAGYFQAKALMKYKVPIGHPLNRSHPITKNLFRELKLVSCLVDLAITGIRFIQLLGSLIGYIKFCNTKKELPKATRRFTKALSYEGNAYILNPILGVCLRAKDVLLIDTTMHYAFSLKQHQGELLRKAIRYHFISEQMGFFIKNKIFIQVG